MPAGVGTGRKHRAAILASLRDGARETIDIAAMLRTSKDAILPSLRGLERSGEIVEAFRRPRRDGHGRKAIVWKLAKGTDNAKDTDAQGHADDAL